MDSAFVIPAGRSGEGDCRGVVSTVIRPHSTLFAAVLITLLNCSRNENTPVESVLHYPQIADSLKQNVILDHAIFDSTLFFATAGGLLSLNPVTNQFNQHALVSETGPVEIFDFAAHESRFAMVFGDSIRYSFGDSNHVEKIPDFDHSLFKVIPSSMSGFWLAGGHPWGFHLYHLEPGGHKTSSPTDSFKAHYDAVTEILESPDNSLFIATQGGLIRYRNGMGEPMIIPGKTLQGINSLAFVSDTLFVATNHIGIWKYGPDSIWSNISTTDLKSEHLLCVANTTLWAATGEALYQRENNGWKRYELTKKTTETPLSSFFYWEDTFYIGTFNGLHTWSLPVTD
jgi:hypothetical protein